MEYEIEHLPFFIINVHRVSYPKAEEFKNKIVPVFQKYEKENPNEIGDYSQDGYTSYFNNQNILQKIEGTKDFFQWMSDIVFKIHKESGLPGSLICQDNWFNINRKYSYHERHIHLPAIWSCVYYVQADYSKDARLQFHSPWAETRWPYVENAQWNANTAQEMQVHSETGCLWIFPSFLYHSVKQQINDNERSSIAANYSLIKQG